MSAEHDRHFFDTFMIVLGILVAFTIAIYFLANVIGDRTQGAHQADNPLKAQQVAQRLAPAGTVAVAGQAAPQPVAAMPVVAAVDSGTAGGSANGEAIYNSACLACHALGVAGAPKFADATAWAPRIAQGTETLYSNAIKGYQGAAGIMPPKGGRLDLSDEEVKAAVDFMVAAAR